MSVCDAFERNACIHIGLCVTEKDVVFPMCLVVVYYVAARDTSRPYAPMTFYRRRLRCGRPVPCWAIAIRLSEVVSRSEVAKNTFFLIEISRNFGGLTLL
jgi:hypothetical protein